MTFILLCILIGIPTISIGYLFYWNWRKSIWLLIPIIIVFTSGIIFIDGGFEGFRDYRNFDFVIITIWFILSSIIVLIPISIGYIFYCKWRKFLWLVPIITVIITGSMFISDVSHIPSRSLIGNIKSYFENGTSLGYIVYIPIVGISLISTIVFLIYDYIGKRRLTKI
ncbi:hypothetical protein [Desulfosporosinus sp. OT]|uniref:hypothetical protein n=1 Tax=Desulfosporosinus sp. OT TaxID=913865 RepID=UPI0002239AF6|nr:hypothetical protein [Desulfosporosinus sp. OT]EGW40904.1 putative membrane protein [Desulfosporosinus sp. OT]